MILDVAPSVTSASHSTLWVCSVHHHLAKLDNLLLQTLLAHLLPAVSLTSMTHSTPCHGALRYLHCLADCSAQDAGPDNNATWFLLSKNKAVFANLPQAERNAVLCRLCGGRLRPPSKLLRLPASGSKMPGAPRLSPLDVKTLMPLSCNHRPPTVQGSCSLSMPHGSSPTAPSRHSSRFQMGFPTGSRESVHSRHGLRGSVRGVKEGLRASAFPSQQNSSKRLQAQCQETGKIHSQGPVPVPVLSGKTQACSTQEPLSRHKVLVQHSKAGCSSGSRRSSNHSRSGLLGSSARQAMASPAALPEVPRRWSSSGGLQQGKMLV